jgi:hypothetical protein
MESTSAALNRVLLVAGGFAVLLLVAALFAQEPTTQPTTQPSDTAVLERMLQELPEAGPVGHKGLFPTQPGQQPAEPRPPAPGVDGSPANPDLREEPLRPEGSTIVDRAGRLVRDGEWWAFAFESEGRVLRERPLRLLPNRMLEFMETASAGGRSSVVFIVSGQVTEYHGANYLLARKVLVERDLGNLRR